VNNKRDTRRDAWDRDYMGNHYSSKPKDKTVDMNILDSIVQAY